MSTDERAPVAIALPFRKARRETDISGLSRSSCATVHPPKIPASRELTIDELERIPQAPLHLTRVLRPRRKIERREKDVACETGRVDEVRNVERFGEQLHAAPVAKVHGFGQPQVDVPGGRRHLNL